MFRWTDDARERAIDLACVPTLTVDEVAERVGSSRKSMFNFYRDNRAKIEAARQSVMISDKMLVRLLDMWGDGISQQDIAVAIGLPADVVRRLILIAEIDEEPEDHGADDSLAALEAAHPDKFYEEDVRALTEYSGWRRPVFLLAADVVAPFSQERVAA
jgi:hypothetical protein